ncbi:retrovirus-related pol polyprotein from transposon TNT 1-94 [Tanacetum coccineum]
MGNGRRCARMWLGFVECLLTSCVGGLRVEPETKITSKRHFLTMKPKWMDSEVLNFLTDRKIDKRYKTSDSISFNTESRDSSVNLNVDAKGDEEDEVQEVAPRPIGRDKAKKLKKKGVGSSGTSSTMNDEALASAEDIYKGRGFDRGRKQNKNKSKSWKIGEIKYRQNITCWNCNQKGHFQNQCSKLVASRDKEVNMAAGDSDDALVCCVENTVEDRIMDSGASFHATYCKEELERFKLRSGKVRLADDKTLDIAGIGDVVLKTSFGTSWTLKDVRYIPGLKRRLISVGQLDKEGYHVGFGDQQWKVTKGSLVVARGNKRGSLYMVEVHPEGIGAIINGSGSAVVDIYFCKPGGLGKQKNLSFIMSVKTRNCRGWSKFIQKALALHLLHQSKDLATMILLSKTTAGVAIGLRIPEEEWRGKDTSRTLEGSGSDEMRYSFRDTKSHQVIRSRDITFADSIYGARSATDSSSLTKPIQKSQVVLVDIPENLAENDSIVAEHGLSSEITQSLGGSSDTSEGSENSGSFKDSGRSDEEYSEDGASSKEGGFETPQVRRSTRESRAPVRYSLSANYLLLTENGEPESYSEALSSKESVQWKKAIIEEMVSLEKNQTWSLVRISAGKKASQRLWMFRVKEEQDDSKRYKARLVEPSYVGALNDTSTQHKSKGFQLAGQEENLEQLLKVDDMLVTGSNMAEFNKPKWKLPLVFEMQDRCSEKHVLGYVLIVGVTTVEWESRLQKSITIYTKSSIHLAKNLKNEEPCRDVHQVGDEREVEALSSLNLPPRLLMNGGAIYRTELELQEYGTNSKDDAYSMLNSLKTKNENDKEDVSLEESSDESEGWDCETIITTYSNLDNHPGRLKPQEEKKI